MAGIATWEGRQGLGTDGPQPQGGQDTHIRGSRRNLAAKMAKERQKAGQEEEKRRWGLERWVGPGLGTGSELEVGTGSELGRYTWTCSSY